MSASPMSFALLRAFSTVSSSPASFPSKQFVLPPRGSTPKSNPESRTPRSTPKSVSKPRAPRDLSTAKSVSTQPIALSTLNPKLLKRIEFIDLSHKLTVGIPFLDSVEQGPLARIQYQSAQDAGRLPFPPHTQGFLYWDNEDEFQSPLAGSLRFRITDSDDRESFERGRNLTWPSGCDWKIMQAQIAIQKPYAPFLTRLLAEGLTTESRISQCRQVFQGEKRFKARPSITLFNFRQPFYANLATALGLVVVGCGEVGTIALPPVFRGTGRDGKTYCAFESGTALLRFEPSTLPEHAGRRILLLRVMRLLSPCIMNALADRVVPPAEGDLLLGRRQIDGTLKPWAYDVDRNKSAKTTWALGLLWPSEGAAG
ncbi:hypothetical protein DFH08DRAFT_875482 [Mycena albidolilacea]|uniref:Uncharacterized protein n=1 Tax=Mycena albidolilacea TaxID=1033008 RepID=A0AAD6ZV55_9AGAR|nr:hypothetical protein DFH08DRAFT_875482 [Mycena albidolilacea]